MPNKQEQAWALLQEAYHAQLEGDYDHAVELYKNSLELFPTAEAHTFLGWTYHFQGKIEDAIQLEKYDEAIPWLERALAAPRYEPRHFPHFNLGRAYAAKGMLARARECFNESLRIEPRYTLARRAVESLRRMVN